MKRGAWLRPRRVRRLWRRLAQDGLLVTPPTPDRVPSREQAWDVARGTGGAVSEALAAERSEDRLSESQMRTRQRDAIKAMAGLDLDLDGQKIEYADAGTADNPGVAVPVGVRELLSDSLTERGLQQWLHARNRALDGRRPLDVLASGDEAAVLSAARAFAEGMYL